MKDILLYAALALSVVGILITLRSSINFEQIKSQTVDLFIKEKQIDVGLLLEKLNGTLVLQTGSIISNGDIYLTKNGVPFDTELAPFLSKNELVVAELCERIESVIDRTKYLKCSFVGKNQLKINNVSLNLTNWNKHDFIGTAEIEENHRMRIFWSGFKSTDEVNVIGIRNKDEIEVIGIFKSLDNLKSYLKSNFLRPKTFEWNFETKYIKGTLVL